MSHTDKDAPYWVKMNQPENRGEAWHSHSLLGKVTKGFRSGKVIFYAEECTIDWPETRDGCTPEGIHYTCHYLPSENSNASRSYYNGFMDYEARHLKYYNTFRRLQREELHNAIKEYNTYGDIEEPALPHYHRGWARRKY